MRWNCSDLCLRDFWSFPHCCAYGDICWGVFTTYAANDLYNEPGAGLKVLSTLLFSRSFVQLWRTTRSFWILTTTGWLQMTTEWSEDRYLLWTKIVMLPLVGYMSNAAVCYQLCITIKTRLMLNLDPFINKLDKSKEKLWWAQALTSLSFFVFGLGMRLNVVFISVWRLISMAYTWFWTNWLDVGLTWKYNLRT